MILMLYILGRLSKQFRLILTHQSFYRYLGSAGKATVDVVASGGAIAKSSPLQLGLYAVSASDNRSRKKDLLILSKSWSVYQSAHTEGRFLKIMRVWKHLHSTDRAGLGFGSNGQSLSLLSYAWFACVLVNRPKPTNMAVFRSKSRPQKHPHICRFRSRPAGIRLGAFTWVV